MKAVIVSYLKNHWEGLASLLLAIVTLVVSFIQNFEYRSLIILVCLALIFICVIIGLIKHISNKKKEYIQIIEKHEAYEKSKDQQIVEKDGQIIELEENIEKIVADINEYENIVNEYSKFEELMNAHILPKFEGILSNVSSEIYKSETERSNIIESLKKYLATVASVSEKDGINILFFAKDGDKYKLIESTKHKKAEKIEFKNTGDNFVDHIYNIKQSDSLNLKKDKCIKYFDYARNPHRSFEGIIGFPVICDESNNSIISIVTTKSHKTIPKVLRHECHIMSIIQMYAFSYIIDKRGE